MLLPIISAGTSKYKPLIDYKWYTSPITDDYILDREVSVDINISNPANFVNEITSTITEGDIHMVSDGTYEVVTVIDSPLIIGTLYEATVIVNSVASAGSIYLGLNATDSIVDVITSGTYTTRFIAIDLSIGLKRSTAVDINISSYSVRRVLQEPDIRYLADSGSSPKYPARSYFGRGAKFNGIDQEIVLPVTFTDQQVSFAFNFVMDSALFGNYLISFSSNPTILVHSGYLRVYISGTNYDTILVNGNHSVVLVIDNGTLKVFSNAILMNTFDVGNIALYDITTTIGSGGGTAFYSGTLSNVQFHDKALTPTQISYQYNYPEKFLYREDTILKSHILTQSEIDNVVAYLPMCETDGYVRDMVGYSETKQITDGSFDTIKVIRDFGGSTTILDNGRGKATNTVDADVRVGVISDNLLEIPIVSGETVKYSFLIETDADTTIQIYNGAAYIDVVTVLTGIQNQIDIVIESVGDYVSTVIKATSASNIWVDNLSVQKLTSTYPITNFTNALRDNAINLDKGLQTCFWKRDILGVPYAGSFDRLECDGVGTFNTGLTISALTSWTIEAILYVDSNNTKESYFVAYPFYMRSLGSNIYARMDNLAGNETLPDGYHHVIMRYNGAVDRNLSVSYNGITTNLGVITQTTDYGLLTLLSSTTLPLRLLKVHDDFDKTPTDLELYNLAVNKGLLS